MEVTSPAGSRAVKTTLIPRVTWVVVAASIAGGLVTLGVAGWRPPGLGQVGESQWIIAAAMGVLALASWVWPVVVYRGGESEAFNTDEGFFVILALLVPPLLTLGTMALATILAQAARRRPLIKSAFNAGQVLVAAGLGLAVSRSIAVPSGSLTAGQLAAMVAGVGDLRPRQYGPHRRRRPADGHPVERVHQRPSGPGDTGRRRRPVRPDPGPGHPGAPVGPGAGHSRRSSWNAS